MKSWSILAACIVAVGACMGPVEPASRVTEITLSPAADTFRTLGRSRQLSATPKDQTGATVPGVSFKWTSSAPGIISVDAAGLNTTVAAGKATSSAAAGRATG